MNSPEPRLNKLPFILTSLVCFAVVVLIGLFAQDRFAPLPMLTSVGFLIASITAFLFPIFADFAADSRESTARLRDELELQIKRVQAASDGLGRAAAQIKAIEEAVQKSARDAETLPYRMQEKLAEFNQALEEKEDEEREALERELEELRAASSDQLKAVAEKIAKATTDWSALEVATRRQLSSAQDAAAKLDAALGAAVGRIDEHVARLQKAIAAAAAIAVVHEPPAAPRAEQPMAAHPPAAEPVHAAPAEPMPPAEVLSAQPEIPAGESPAASEPAAVEPSKPKRVRPPRKPKPEETLAAMSEAPAVAAPVAAEPESLAAPVAVDDAPPAPEASVSSDGATRLLATAYIGIGNKLFIRGDGPGLSWDHGVPMQFVSIGKWGWSTQEATGPISLKLYKNDETAALSGGVTIEPGRHTEITALF